MSNARIMVVDDSAYMRDLIEEILEDEGFEVRQAANAINFLDEVEEYNPNIVFMDVVMPQMDGIEATKALREKMPNVKIVICSAHNNIAIQKKALESGANAFLPKPLDVKRIEKIINDLCK